MEQENKKELPAFQTDKADAEAYAASTGVAYSQSALRNVAALTLYALIEKRSTVSQDNIKLQLQRDGMADATVRRQVKAGWEIAKRINAAFPNGQAWLNEARKANNAELATQNVMFFFHDMGITDASRDALLWANGDGAPLTAAQKMSVRTFAAKADETAKAKAEREATEAIKKAASAKAAADKAEAKAKEIAKVAASAEENMEAYRASVISEYLADENNQWAIVENYIAQASPGLLQEMLLIINKRLEEAMKDEMAWQMAEAANA